MEFDNRIDPINTTLSNPPGAWSAPFKYSVYEKLPSEIWEKQEPSISCDIATTAGDRQVSWCKPSKPNCPMSRELEPTQHVDGDISYCVRDGDVFGNNYKILNKGPYSTEVVRSCNVQKRPKKKAPSSETNLLFKIAIVIILIMVLVKLASKF